MELPVIITVFFITFLAGLLQGSVGFGFALLASSALMMINSDFLPLPLIVTHTTIAFLVILREHKHFDLKGLHWAIIGRIVGTIIAIILISLFSGKALEWIMFAFLAALPVLLLLRSHFKASWRSLTIAGLLSGLMGTIISVSGAPLAMVMSGEKGEGFRTKMSGFTVLGSLLSVFLLMITNNVGAVTYSLIWYLLPGALLGFFLSYKVAKKIETLGLRKFLFVFISISVVVTLVKLLIS